MSCEPIEKWLKSGKYAKLNGIYARPVEHQLLKGSPLSVQKGQAEVFPLISDDNRRWMLKKLYPGKRLDRHYLESVSRIIPKDDGFVAGTNRQILSHSKLVKENGRYYSPKLAEHINDTILMPQIKGSDWFGLADEVRRGDRMLPKNPRLKISSNLAGLVESLERNDSCHRDFSGGNVFIHTGSWQTSLIDFDSFYHPSLDIPDATTCGTTGYIPSFGWWGGGLDAGQTWCRYADRYALGILITEFLIVEKGCPFTYDGGLFDQDELRNRSGPGISDAISVLRKSWPSVLPLFERTINAYDFNSCPSPSQWISAIGGSSHSLKLGEIEQFVPNIFVIKTTLSLRHRVPSLSEMPSFNLNINSMKLTLPPDPWS